jgi:hypothetical protein
MTFVNPVVVGVADKVKTLAAQGSHGSFSGLGSVILSEFYIWQPPYRVLVDGVFWYTKHVHYTLVWICLWN